MPPTNITWQPKHRNGGDLTSLFCISVNRSGRVRNRTAGVLANEREGLLDTVLLLVAGTLLTLLGELSESAANHQHSSNQFSTAQHATHEMTQCRSVRHKLALWQITKAHDKWSRNRKTWKITESTSLEHAASNLIPTVVMTRLS